jgi:hypothetical protein
MVAVPVRYACGLTMTGSFASCATAGIFNTSRWSDVSVQQQTRLAPGAYG